MDVFRRAADLNFPLSRLHFKIVGSCTVKRKFGCRYFERQRLALSRVECNPLKSLQLVNGHLYRCIDIMDIYLRYLITF